MTSPEQKSRPPRLSLSIPQPIQAATWTVVLLVTLAWTWFAAAGITWYDSGELVAAALHLGLSHPPGQPLYGQLGKLATLLPLGSIAFRCNVLSALAGGVALAGLAQIARRSAGEKAALIAVSLAALTWPMAQQTMRAEVYAPALAAIIWSFVLATGSRHPQASRLGAASLLLGLAAGLHPLLAALAWFGLTISVMADRSAKRRLPAFGALLAGAVLGNLIWLTLPAAGNRPALLPWSQLDSVRGIWATITAQAYRQNITGGHLSLSLRLIANARLLGQLSGTALTSSGLIGLLALTVHNKQKQPIWPAWILLVVGLGAAATMNVFYAGNPDIHGYLLASVVALALASGVGLVRIGQMLAVRSPEGNRPWHRVFGAATAGLVVIWSAWQNSLSIADQTHRVGRADRFLAAVSAPARPGPGLVVASSDHALFTLAYAKAAENWRPDLALVSRWLLGADAPWYRRWIKKRWPWLFVPLIDDSGPPRGMRLRFEMTNASRMPTYLEDPPERLWHQVKDCGLFYALVPEGDKKKPCLQTARWPKLLAPNQAKLIGCYMACRRARFLASHGHLTEAAGLLRPFLERPLPKLAPLASEFLCTGARPLVLAAQIRTAEGDRRGAMRILSRAMALDPRFPDTYVELGRLLAAGGDLLRARRLELRALALNPGNVIALFYLALIEQRLGHRRRAEALLRRAMALDPEKVRSLLRAHGAAPSDGPTGMGPAKRRQETSRP